MPNFKTHSPNQAEYDTDHQQLLSLIQGLQQRLGNTAPSLAIVKPQVTAAGKASSSGASSAGGNSSSSGGTVKSVTVTSDSVIFGSPTGNPIKDTGTINLPAKSFPANTALMGPTSGADAAPTIRQPAVGDISGFPSFADNEAPSGTINGINPSFTVAHAPSPTTSVHLYMSGLRITPTGNFSVSGTTITFTVAPAIGAVLLVDYRY